MAVQTFALLGLLTPAFGQLTISTTSVPPMMVNRTVNTQLAATGGTGNLTWTVEAGSTVPTGVSMGNNGLISGTPLSTTGSPHPFNVRVTDSATPTPQSAAKAFTLTVLPELVINAPLSLPNAQLGSTYSQGFTATGGQGAQTWSATGLPTGLSINPTSGLLSGTPQTSGTFSSVVVRVSDATSPTPFFAEKTYTLTVTGASLSITTASPLPNGVVSQAYPQQTLAATGGTGTGYNWAVQTGSTLPSNLALSAAGVLSGTPTSAGTFNFTLQVTDSANTTATKAFTLTIAAPLTITTASPLPSGVVNQAYASQTLAATGGTGTGYAWGLQSGSALPNGMTLSAGGVLGGTPTVAGTFNFTVQVTDSANTPATKAFSLTISSGLNITNASPLPNAVVNQAYPQQTLAATGGTGTGYSWGLQAGSSLPNGLTLTPAGVLSGTPTAAGSFSFIVQVTDSASNSGTKTFQLTIGTALTITSTTLPNGTLNQTYPSTSLSASGGSGTGYVWSVASGSNLPAGLTLTPTGVLSGAPTAAGTFGFTLQVTDSATNTATRAFTLTVDAGLTITTVSPLPGGTSGAAYGPLTFTATGGSGTGYNWAVAAGSSLPGGLTLSSAGVLSGTPNSAGSFSFTVRVTDSASTTTTKTFSLSIAAASTLTISTTTLPSWTVGIPYSQALTATGNSGAMTWSVAIGSLPPGLNLAPGTGVISGTPTTAGSSSFTVQVADTGSNAQRTLSLGINPVPQVTTLSLAQAGLNSPFTTTLSASGGTAPLTWSIQGALPAGITLTPATGVISGTATTSGSFPITCTVTDSVGATASRQLTLAVGTNLTIPTQTLPNGTLNFSYGPVTLSASGGTGTGYTWSVLSGQLPPGITLAASGTLTGIPNTAGTFPFVAQVRDSGNATASLGLSIAVTASSLLVTTLSPLPQALQGAVYATTLSASGGSGTGYTWTLLGSTLPPGLTLSSTGQISGTPTAAGVTTFTAQVNDSVGNQATRQFSLAVAATPVSITTSSPLTDAVTGIPYIAEIRATGGAPGATYQFSIPIGNLPNGLNLQSSGTLSGTPTSVGTSNFTVQVNDGFGGTAARPFSLSVTSPNLSISTQALPSAGVGQPYSATLAASGGTAPLVWTVTAGLLPAGLTLNAQTGIISGAPLNPGTFNFTIQLRDTNNLTASVNFTIQVLQFAITTTTLPQASAGASYSATLSTVGGTAPITWSLAGGSSLPAGISLNPSTGVLSGTPTTAGTSTFTLQARDATQATAVQTLSLTVTTSLTIVTQSLPGGTVGQAYSQTLQAAGGSTPYDWRVISGALPPGLTLAPTTGVLSGTPSTTVGSPSTFVVRVTDSASRTATQSLTISIAAAGGALSITTGATLPASLIGTPYSQVLTASGGTAPFTWALTSGSLPTGITLNPSGTLTGTPTQAGTFSFTLSVTDAASQTAARAFSIVVTQANALQVTTSSLPAASVGNAYSQTLTASGGSGTGYSWSIVAGSLPAGLTLNASGAITGTPTAAGTANFTVQVRDSQNNTAVASLSISAAAATTLSITTTALPAGTVGAIYPATTLTATGGTGAGYSWSSVSGLPSGLILSSAGVISGNPALAGTFTVQVRVTDSAGSSTTRDLTLLISSTTALSVATTALPAATAGVAYPATTLAATGGTGSGYNWTVTSGLLPPGVTLSTAGLLSGTPTSPGTFTVTIRVQDSGGNQATRQFNLTVSGSLAINALTLPEAAIGSPYNQILTASGGTGAGYTFELVTPTLPAGLSLSPTGVISGTVASTVPPGVVSFTVRVRDSAGALAERTFALNITNTALQIDTSSLAQATVNIPYSFALTARGGTAPYTWFLASGLLPTGLSLSSTGVISGTPTTPGSYLFSVIVRDLIGLNTTRQMSLVVSVGALSVVTTSLNPGSVGAPYTAALQSQGGTGPFQWTVNNGQLPPGVTLSSGGQLTGTPTIPGSYVFTVQVNDAVSNIGSRQLTLQINGPLAISTLELPGATVSLNYNQTLAGSGGAPPYTWSITSGLLPAGLTLNPATGAIAGTPTSSGPSTFNVQITDAVGATASRTLSINVGTSLSINTTTLANGATGIPYAQPVTASGGVPPLQWSVTGPLPPGLTLGAANGTISGTPTATGSYPFVIQVRDATGSTATRQLSITIAEGLTITTGTSLPQGSEGVPYTQALGATGGSTPYSWAVTIGILPPGLQLDATTGEINGTPTTVGNYSFIVQVTDAQQQSAQKAFTIAIPSRMSIVTPSVLPAATVRQPYSETLTANGGVAPYTWALAPGGTPPIGITISEGGVISGTPTSAGAFSFTVQVTDSQGNTAIRAFSLNVVLNLSVTSASPITAATAGVAYAQALAASGGQPPYTWAVTSGDLPPGLSLSAAGILTGTPTAAGSYTFTVEVTDNTRATASAPITLTITSPTPPSVTIQGLGDTVEPQQQPRITLSVSNPYPLPLSGTLTLTFASDAAVPVDDAAVVFANGQRNFNFTIPANGTQAQFTGGSGIALMQTGTVAGTIRLSAVLRSAGQDITPSPAPVLESRLRRGVPVIVSNSVRATRVSGGLQVDLSAYATSREVTGATFRFTPAPGSALQTTELTVPLTEGAQRWYQSDQSRAFGSSFTLSQRFNVTGDTTAIRSVTVTLTNAQGTSQSVTVDFQ
ncbi:MAG: putative Ig domain-containing protein [Bryobacterales bacterium]|nr:putative Ig domain-containing protein [Bryobacterales bacterium]